jgi:hypothetical protein
LGCDRATLIFDRLEFYSKKQPDGFYKFLEPNSHKLYKEGESWAELLRCHRTSFWRSFKLIGKKHKSQWAFEAAKDKFEGKLYASYYDRLNNRMFFIRNDEAVDELFAKIQPGVNPTMVPEKNKENSQPSPGKISDQDSVPTEQDARSHKEAKKTSSELFKNNSYASNEIVKKMIDIWTALVEEGRGQISLTRQRITFLRKAFTDRFDSCLDKWKKYCVRIASSKFLMGEVNDFKADIDWALKFANIQKVFEGRYGIGKRAIKVELPRIEEIEEEIFNTDESQEIKDFRKLSLKTVGNAMYISYFKNLSVEFREEGILALVAPHAHTADMLERSCFSYFRLIFNELDRGIKSFELFVAGEKRGRLLERRREAKCINTSSAITESELSTSQQIDAKGLIEEMVEVVGTETRALRTKLKESIPPKQFPNWLAGIEVDRIDPDGNLIVTFKEQIIADYCQARFRPELLKSAQELWSTVKNLLIQEKLVDSFGDSEEEPIETDETLMFQDALQSLKNPSMMGVGQGEFYRIC